MKEEGKNLPYKIQYSTVGRIGDESEKGKIWPIDLESSGKSLSSSSPRAARSAAHSPSIFTICCWDQPPHHHSIGRPPSRQSMQTRVWGCGVHFGVRLRFGLAGFHATSPKAHRVNRENQPIGHARPSHSNPFLCGGPPCTPPRHHPRSTPSFVERSSHLGNGGIVQEVRQMAKGTRNVTTDIGWVIITTMSQQLLPLMAASSSATGAPRLEMMPLLWSYT